MNPYAGETKIGKPSASALIFAMIGLCAALTSRIGMCAGNEIPVTEADKKVLAQRELMVSLFDDACEILQNDPDMALDKIQRLLKMDAYNANVYYLKAAVYARKNKLNEMGRNIILGNRQQKCTLYVAVPGAEVMDLPIVHYVHLRNVARASTSALATEELLLAVRVMGRKVMEEWPLRALSCLTGMEIVSLADDALVKIYQKQGQTDAVGEWEKRRAADRKWSESTKTSIVIMLQQLQQNASRRGGNDLGLASIGKQKLDTVALESLKRERIVVEQALAKRPS